MTPEKIKKIRRDTAAAMTCTCGGRRLIGVSGMLVCEHGCGRLLPIDVALPRPKKIKVFGDGQCRATMPFYSADDLRAAWPERVIYASVGLEAASRRFRDIVRQQKKS